MQVLLCCASAKGNHKLCGHSGSWQENHSGTWPNVPHCRNMLGYLLGTLPMSLIIVLYLCLSCAMRLQL
jgi:hypothetical protein